MKIKLISLMIAALAAPALAESTSDPSQQARVHVQDNSVYTLSNHLLTRSSSAKAPAVFTLQQKGRAAAQSSQSPFSITTTEGIYPTASFTISDIKIDRLYPAEVSIAPSHQHHGQSITATFKNEQAGITIKWSAELRDGENYVTQVYAIYATRPIEITHIDLLKLAGTGFVLEDKAQPSFIAPNACFSTSRMSPV